MKLPILSLEDACLKITDGTHHSPPITPSGIPYVTAKHVKPEGLKFFEDPWFVSEEDHRAIYSRCDPKKGDVLYIKDGATTGIAALNDYDFPFSMLSSVALLRPKPELCDPRFLCWWLNSPLSKEKFIGQMGGAAIKRLTLSKIKRFEIPLPPLAEQRRIAEVLDRAEALRAKRRAALAELDSLTQSLFLDLFGDPVTNPKGWPMVSLESVLSIPLRNGLSPSKSGKVNANVLTLSAITGNRFDASAWKTSTFMSRPPANQSVSELDFLICRGNGNVHMVGKGYFPSEAMPEMTFPDTMIAARISPERIERAFLQHVWNSSAVRKQVESVARTTNGTFKVNQPSLEGIQFVSPPITLQQEFARRVGAVEKLKQAQLAALAEQDALFATLQHRAFRGEL